MEVKAQWQEQGPEGHSVHSPDAEREMNAGADLHPLLTPPGTPA